MNANLPTTSQRDRAAINAAERAVLAIPNGDRATLVVTGADRASWLNGLLTSDLALLAQKSGEVGYGLFVGRNGRILADAFVVLDGTRVLVSVPRAVVTALRQHLDHYLVMEDAEVAPDADAFETWTLHGPGSDDVLAAARRHGGVGGVLDRTGFGGALVFAPVEVAANVRVAIEGAVADKGGVTGDDGAWEALRLERGIPRFGFDFDEKVYPQEASLEKVAVSFNKGCYLGQEVVCMLEMRGHVKRKLAALVIEAGNAPERGTPVADEAGVAIGEVTSSAMSPSLGKPLVFAMIKRGHAEPGSQLRVGGARAQVVLSPTPRV